MSFIKRIGAYLFLALYLLSPGVGQAADKVFMWKADNGRGAIYLLGSIHTADKSFYPMDPAIMAAFDRSSRLVVEVDINNQDQQALQQMLLMKGFYSDGDSLDKHISEETQKAIVKYLDGNEMMMQVVGRMRPWAVYVTLEEMEMRKVGLDPTLGIDLHFLEKASEEGKKISELESMEMQLELLAGFADDLQENLIMMTITDTSKRRDSVGSIIFAWKSGNAPLMENLVFASLKDDPKMEPVYEKMFFLRNAEMADNIARMAARGETIFVVVGAGHLVGDRGVVQLLKNKGYSITQQTSAK